MESADDLGMEAGEADSLEVIDEIEDEGISDISTHETIINPSSGNDKYVSPFITSLSYNHYLKGFQCIHWPCSLRIIILTQY